MYTQDTVVRIKLPNILEATETGEGIKGMVQNTAIGIVASAHFLLTVSFSWNCLFQETAQRLILAQEMLPCTITYSKIDETNANKNTSAHHVRQDTVNGKSGQSYQFICNSILTGSWLELDRNYSVDQASLPSLALPPLSFPPSSWSEELSLTKFVHDYIRSTYVKSFNSYQVGEISSYGELFTGRRIKVTGYEKIKGELHS